MKAHTIIFIGPQGSGKGTQAEKLIAHMRSNVADTKIVEIQTGKGFRELKELDSYTGRRINELYDTGELMPNFLTETIVVNQLMEDLTEDAHLFMDGFPRNQEQATFLDSILQFYLRKEVGVVYLDTPEDVSRERMMGRGRSDDTEASINERLRLYHEMTEPVLEHYHNRPNTNFVKIDGTAPIEVVHKAIKQGLAL